MKIIFNTRHPLDSSYIFYREAFSRISEASFLDYEHYEAYDIAIFMAQPDDLRDIARAKERNPSICVGVCDPRGSFVFPYGDQIDFFIVDSIEMKDFFAHLGKPIHVYREYPWIEPRATEHRAKDKVVIGYHGNKLHLSSLFPRVTHALDALAERYNVELWAVYNMKALGPWRVGLPRKIPVRHIQWHEKVYQEEFSEIDIGLCPNLMLMKNLDLAKRLCGMGKYFLESKDDYLIRFKMPSNPGRIITFALMGVPVVTDFLPSSLQLVRDGENGYVAYSVGGWFRALESLINQPEQRSLFAKQLQDDVLQMYGPEKQNKDFLGFCRDLVEGKVVSRPPVSQVVKGTSWMQLRFDLIIEFFYKICRFITRRLKVGK